MYTLIPPVRPTHTRNSKTEEKIMPPFNAIPVSVIHAWNKKRKRLNHTILFWQMRSAPVQCIPARTTLLCTPETETNPSVVSVRAAHFASPTAKPTPETEKQNYGQISPSNKVPVVSDHVPSPFRCGCVTLAWNSEGAYTPSAAQRNVLRQQIDHCAFFITCSHQVRCDVAGCFMTHLRWWKLTRPV